MNTSRSKTRKARIWAICPTTDDIHRGRQLFFVTRPRVASLVDKEVKTSAESRYYNLRLLITKLFEMLEIQETTIVSNQNVIPNMVSMVNWVFWRFDEAIDESIKNTEHNDEPGMKHVQYQTHETIKRKTEHNLMDLNFNRIVCHVERESRMNYIVQWYICIRAEHVEELLPHVQRHFIDRYW